MGQLLTGKLSATAAEMGTYFDYGKDKAVKGERWALIFNMQCPRYSGPPTPTASVANLYKSKIL